MKLLLNVFLFLFLFTNTSFALTYEPNPSDLWDLRHQEYYIWTIDLSEALERGPITEASLTFKNIRNWDDGDNRLFVNLFDGSGDPGSIRGWDQYLPNQIANEFGDEGQLFETSFTSSPETFVYEFSAFDLYMLNTFGQDGLIALGFDSDCHLYNDGITFSVPEPGVLALLFPTFLIFGFLKRKHFG